MCTNTPQDALQTTRPLRAGKPGAVTPTAELINPSRRRERGRKQKTRCQHTAPHSATLWVTFWTSDDCILIWLSSRSSSLTLPPLPLCQANVGSGAETCFYAAPGEVTSPLIPQTRGRSLEAQRLRSLPTGRKEGDTSVWNSSCTISTLWNRRARHQNPTECQNSALLWRFRILKIHNKHANLWAYSYKITVTCVVFMSAYFLEISTHLNPLIQTDTFLRLQPSGTRPRN